MSSWLNVGVNLSCATLLTGDAVRARMRPTMAIIVARAVDLGVDGLKRIVFNINKPETQYHTLNGIYTSVCWIRCVIGLRPSTKGAGSKTHLESR